MSDPKQLPALPDATTAADNDLLLKRDTASGSDQSLSIETLRDEAFGSAATEDVSVTSTPNTVAKRDGVGRVQSASGGSGSAAVVHNDTSTSADADTVAKRDGSGRLKSEPGGDGNEVATASETLLFRAGDVFTIDFDANPAVLPDFVIKQSAEEYQIDFSGIAGDAFVEVVGGGGGAADSANSGGDTTFDTMTAGGGRGSSAQSAGRGGSATGGDINIKGQSGISKEFDADQPASAGGTSGRGDGSDVTLSVQVRGAGAQRNNNRGTGGGGGYCAKNYRIKDLPSTAFTLTIGEGGSGARDGGDGYAVVTIARGEA